jgi:succinyl-diaminopimelate desuccinylase
MLPLVLIPGILLVLLLNISRTASPGAVLDTIVERNTGIMVSSVQELVRVRSVAGEPAPEAPTGTGPRDALVLALRIAERLGLSTVNLDNYAGYAEFGNGPEYVAALGHVDVVPEGEGWAHPPYGGEIYDGKIYGRGSLDDKGPALAALFGARAVMESGLPLARRVRVIFGTDEETGDLDIPYYLSREPRPVAGFTPDADFPVVFAEKGILWIELEKKLSTPAHGTVVTSIAGGTAVNMVPDAATAEIRTVHPDMTLKKCSEDPRESCSLIDTKVGKGKIEIRALGESAHASTPEEGKNAIQELLSFLGDQKLSPGGMTDAIRFFCRTLGKETDGKSFDLALKDEVSGALTLNAGMIDAGPEHFRLTLDIRYPVTIGLDRVLGLVRAKARDGGFSVRVVKHQPPLHYPVDSELVTKLAGVYREATGDMTPPVAIGGGTYARRMPNTVAFGPYRPGSKPPIHRQDECIAIDELVALAKIYARAIYALAK